VKIERDQMAPAAQILGEVDQIALTLGQRRPRAAFAADAKHQSAPPRRDQPAILDRPVDVDELPSRSTQFILARRFVPIGAQLSGPDKPYQPERTRRADHRGRGGRRPVKTATPVAAARPCD
jgi:hypothetical protein